MKRRQPRSTRTDTLFPDTTLFRSTQDCKLRSHLKYPSPQIGRFIGFAPLSRRIINSDNLLDRRSVARKLPSVFLRQKAAGVAGNPRQGTIPSILRAPSRSIRSDRSEERRVGKECVSTCRSRWSPYH